MLPPHFSELYAQQMLQTAEDQARDLATSPNRHAGAQLRFAAYLFSDLTQTWIREEIQMVRRFALRRLFFTHALILSVVALALSLGAYVVMQQTLRRGANQPQQQMAELAVSHLRHTGPVASICKSGCTDIADTLEPFVIVYDETGHVLNSSAALGDVPPVPPAGVFDHARTSGSNTLTWQPRRGVRLATVVRHFSGDSGSGFVLAARSLVVVEDGEALAFRCAFFGWLSVVALLLCLAAFFSNLENPPQPQQSAA
jgi:hypothetical protein